MEESKGKRLAINTVLLYIRTFITLIISLYTSRIVLDVLGVDDYGIYSVVGGIVAMLSIISSSLTTAISRYLTYALGNKSERLKDVFSASITIQVLISGVIIVVGEIVGVWFLNTQMNIPEGRMEAANWVFQCSMFTFLLKLVAVPFISSIISHERMKVFAFVGILDALLMLAIAFTLAISPIDKLVLYAILVVIANFTTSIIYFIYCRWNFEECVFRLHINKSLFKEMLGFASWNFFSNAFYMLNTQGVSILINIFYGVAVNASRGIATQVDSAVKNFVRNFTTAINPQIIKAYAEGDKSYLTTLIIKGAKYTFFLFMVFAVPFLLETEYVLNLWLKQVPENTLSFLRLTFIYSIIDSIGNTGYIACVATGKMKLYVQRISTIGCLIFPITWILFYFGAPVEAAYIVSASIAFVCLFVRLTVMKRLLEFNPKDFVNKALVPIFFVGITAFIIPYFVKGVLDSSFIRLLIVCVVSELSLAGCIYVFGLTTGEKEYCFNFIWTKILKHNN